MRWIGMMLSDEVGARRVPGSSDCVPQRHQRQLADESRARRLTLDLRESISPLLNLAGLAPSLNNLPLASSTPVSSSPSTPVSLPTQAPPRPICSLAR